MKTKKTKQVSILLILLATLVCVVSIRVTAEESENYYQERVDKAHWMAECMRSLSWDKGTAGQQAALRECGYYWHTANDARKELIAKKQELARQMEAEKPKLEFWQTCEITAYEWTGERCANGNYPTTGYTVACNSLPLGTKVYIEGIGYRTVEDRGATWHKYNWMDEFLYDPSACEQFGVQWHDVYLVK